MKGKNKAQSPNVRKMDNKIYEKSVRNFQNITNTLIFKFFTVTLNVLDIAWNSSSGFAKKILLKQLDSLSHYCSQQLLAI